MEAGGLDVLKYIGIARRRGPMVAAFGLLGGLLGAIYALQLIPVYTATATLLIDPNQANVLSPDQNYNSYIDDGTIESELSIINSSSVARRVATKLNLKPDEMEGQDEPSVFSLLLGHLKSLVSSAPAPAEAEVGIPDDPVEDLAQSLKGGVDVSRQGFSYLIDVSYTSDNPSLAAAVANGFADEYLVDQLETRYESTKRTNDWLNERLGDLRTKVRDSERAVEVFKAENNIVENQGSTLSDQQLAKLNEQLILARAETAQAKASYDQVQAAAKRGADLSSFADSAQAAAIGAMRAKASEVRRELTEATVKYGSRHPTVVALRAQLSDVNRQIGSETARAVSSAENQYRVALSREQSIEASLGEMKGGVSETNTAEITLRELEREAQANKALYESFLTKFKETSEQEKLRTSTARIIERAKVPDTPSAPKRSRIAMMWLMAGLALGAGLAFIMEHLDRGFHSSKQTEEMLGVPVLASVPKADGEVDVGILAKLLDRFDILTPLARLLRLKSSRVSKKDRTKRALMSNLTGQKPLSTYTEAIRALRMGIRFADVDNPRKVVLITSALPGEGKSTIASNLAQHAVRAGERVVLVDMDLRHPAISEVYAPNAKKGVLDLALGEAELKDVLLFEQSTGLAILPGPRNNGFTHTAEVLGSNRIKDLLQQLSKVFDLVIIDTSPLLPVTDGRVLIDSVDAMVLVIKWEDTKRDAVEAALDACYQLDDKFIGTVLNGVIPSKARYYSYYKSGYYMNKYPDYYGGKA
jgi:exopolysaccharide transport family protein